jgi:SAM-dependent methyltransferase
VPVPPPDGLLLAATGPGSRATPAEGAGPADADQSWTYGAQFAGIYDRLFCPLSDTGATVGFLRRLVPEGGAALELGVGTGRVAVPLAATGVRVTGVDSSPQMLAGARRNAELAEVALDLVEGDIRSWRSPVQVDLVLCLCATVSMFAAESEQLAVLMRAVEAVRPGGAVVVETHSPARIRRLHEPGPRVELALDVPGLPGGLQTVAQLSTDGLHWDVSHRWREDGELRTAREFSRLTAPADLARLATRAGLVPVTSAVDWSGGPADQLGPTYVSVFRHPAERAPTALGAAASPTAAVRSPRPDGPHP